MKRRTRAINIRPGVSILSVLKSLNYKPWFALAEFVDNALASYLAHKGSLRTSGVKRLLVEIDFRAEDGGRLVVRDNAAGIAEADYGRAFRPAQLPPDRTGLSEFGMGMKSAACWFARRWSVRTCALGEKVERTIRFDIDAIVKNDLEEIEPTIRKARPGAHGTELILEDLYQVPQTRTLGKMKQHLVSIYRQFIRDESLELRFNGEPLTRTEPKVLRAPYFRTPAKPAKVWRKEINISLGRRRAVRGFAALRETGSTSEAGFALFRRGRLIQGSADEGYRPEAIFGKSNSYRYQRLFGELHLEGFEVSHTKDGFRWEENEEPLLSKLLQALDEDPLPLISQAEGHRSRTKPAALKPAAEAIVARTSDAIREYVPSVIAHQLESAAPGEAPPAKLPKVNDVTRRSIDIDLRGTVWRVIIEVSADPQVSDWVDLCDAVDDHADGSDVRTIGVRLSLAHPFTERFAGTDPAQLEPLLRIAAALVLAETVARLGGVRKAGAIRHNFNDLLKLALSKP